MLGAGSGIIVRRLVCRGALQRSGPVASTMVAPVPSAFAQESASRALRTTRVRVNASGLGGACSFVSRSCRRISWMPRQLVSDLRYLRLG